MIWGFVQIEGFGNSVDKMMIDHVIFGYPMFKNKLMWDEKRGQSMMSSFFLARLCTIYQKTPCIPCFL
jgi:hypothetical protein